MTPAPTPPHVSLLTPLQPGAVAILLVHGCNAAERLAALLSRPLPAPHTWTLARVADLDDAVVLCLDAERYELMPHGGTRIVQRLLQRLIDAGFEPQHEPDPLAIYPEAANAQEARILALMARAASPLALGLLARCLSGDAKGDAASSTRLLEDLSSAGPLGHLLVPPTVVIAGVPNVGKSTLTNAMLGHTQSLVADEPGTTRDWTAGQVMLEGLGAHWQTRQSGMQQKRQQKRGQTPFSHLAAFDAVAVRWLDTPGLRPSDDTVEQQAIAQARDVLGHADVLIVMRDAQTPWPDPGDLPRPPDLWVLNKQEQAPPPAADAGSHRDHPLPISALTLHHLDPLQMAIFRVLGLDRIDP